MRLITGWKTRRKSVKIASTLFAIVVIISLVASAIVPFATPNP